MLRTLGNLFWSFARIGGLTFGGGYAMLPMLQKEVVEHHGWATEEDLADYYAIGQCTPGVIAVNTATFVGYKQLGVLGGVVATLGVVFPSLIIITIIAAFINNFADFEIVKNAFAGIRVCVCVMILNAVLKLKKNAIPNTPAMILFWIVFLLSCVTNISPVWFVIGAGLAGLLIKRIGGKKQ